MQKIHQSIIINAPRQKVWDTMLGNATYREWTKPFMEGSDYTGDWSQGSKMLFTAPNKEGGTTGMISRIKENRPLEFMSIEHIGIVENGVEDTTSDKVSKWAGALENYTLKDVAGGTEVTVDMDVNEDEREYMDGAWKKGLEALKEVAERS